MRTTRNGRRKTGNGPRAIAGLLAGALAGLAAGGTGAAASPAAVVETDHIRAEIVLRAAEVAPGDTVDVAIRQTIAEGWHTYWINPGDSGDAMRLDWTLPEGASAGPLRWPAPERIPYPPLMNYGFAEEVTVLTSLTVPQDWTAGRPLPVDLSIDWLVCEKICIPESGSASFVVPTGEASVPDSLSAFTFVQAERALPRRTALSATATVGDERIALAVATPGPVSDAYFFPRKTGLIDHAAPQALSRDADGLVLDIPRGRAMPPDPLRGVLALTDATGTVTHHALAARVEDARSPEALAAAAAPPAAPAGPAAGPAVPTGATVPAAAFSGVLHAALFALLGGLVLNLMPCVFPVLALKAVGLVDKADAPAAERAAHGLLYTAGILACFMVLAAALIAVKAAGAEVGWGFQLQDPLVVAVLAYVIFAVGLNLSGLFEVGASLTRAGNLDRGSGRAGAFLTGLLAAVVATPCTAPFMALAIGFALTAGTGTTLVVFLALGLGLALPFLLLSLVPGLARLMPRPGAWMVRLRQALAFPMYLAAAWLVWVLAQQAGADAILLTLVGFVGLAFGGWLLGLAQHGAAGRGRRTALAGAAAGGLAAIVMLVPLALGTTAGSATAATRPAGQAGVMAEPYSPARLAALRAEGRAVFLNVTAAWCISCKVNEQVALAGDGFREALAAGDYVYMVGDWTRRDEDITRLLADFGRAGVPLYAVYPAGGGAPTVLPQILTEGMVVEALSAR